MNNLIWWGKKLSIPGSMVILGLVVMAYGNHIVEQSAASSLWPTTIGKIVVSQMATSTWSEGTSSLKTRTKPKTENRYSADVQYEYRAQGQFYTGNTIRLIMPLHSSPDAVQPLLERYPVGERVRVFFNPRDPGESVLETVVDEDTYTLYYMGVLWSVVWGGVLVVAAIVTAIKEARRRKKA